MVDKKENDYRTTTLKRIRTCNNCHHTHDTFKNYHILNNRMYKERKQEYKKTKQMPKRIIIIATHKLQNNAQLEI